MQRNAPKYIKAWEERQAKKRAIEEAQAENARQIRERAEAYKREAEAADAAQRAKIQEGIEASNRRAEENRKRNALNKKLTKKHRLRVKSFWRLSARRLQSLSGNVKKNGRRQRRNVRLLGKRRASNRRKTIDTRCSRWPISRPSRSIVLRTGSDFHRTRCRCWSTCRKRRRPSWAERP